MVPVAAEAPVPDVAVMVRLVAFVGTAAEDAAVSVRVETARSSGLPEVIAGTTVVVLLVLEPALVLQLAVTPAGSPVTARLAEVPVAKAPPAFTVMALAAVPPCTTFSGLAVEYGVAEDTASVGLLSVTVRLKVPVLV